MTRIADLTFWARLGHGHGVRSSLAPMVAIAAFACTSPAEVEHCPVPPLPQISEAPTWHEDVRRVVEARCASCHVEGGIGPFPLTSYAEVFAARDAVKGSVTSGTMPPWLVASCCGEYRDDFSLTPEQIATIATWVDTGALEGDPADAPEPIEAVGGLSRVDLEVQMPEPYTPQPSPGRVDDFRCFVADWPLDEPMWITGLEPVPGARPIVHHLVVAIAEGGDADKWDDLKAEDGRPGIPCEGGFGDAPFTQIVGGSLLGGDHPDGTGILVRPGSKVVFSLHYSLAGRLPAADQTAVRFKLEPDVTELALQQTIVLGNPAWLFGNAMLVPANETRTYKHQIDARLFTRGKRAQLLGVVPHMHELGESTLVTLIKKDGTQRCLLDIPRWDFGWEQPHWFAAPIIMEKGDQIRIECSFDNTLQNQPIINGERQAPRDIAWGSDFQDMCSAFVSWIEAEQ